MQPGGGVVAAMLAKVFLNPRRHGLKKVPLFCVEGLAEGEKDAHTKKWRAEEEEQEHRTEKVSSPSPWSPWEQEDTQLWWNGWYRRAKFLFIILLIFIAEVSAFVLGFIYRSKVESDFRQPLQHVFQEYDGKNSQSHAIDYLQDELQCCGVGNYTDWIGSRWYNTSGNHSIPASCCKEQFRKNCTGSLGKLQYLNTEGCADKMVFAIQSVLSYAMLVVLGFAIVKFFGMMSICVLTCRRDNGYDRLHSGVFA
ncbi:tetraspanin-36-like isoform X1 [Paroedura picta]|uniref:tetraspanin-36-like isoform X1 n=1 Tax=Paroedura picta TaxID=143630 RepID=UPI0040562D3D